MKRIAVVVTSLTLPAAVFVSYPAAAAGNIHTPTSSMLTVKLATPTGVTPSVYVKTPTGKTPLSTTTSFTVTTPGVYKVSAKKVVTADGIYTPRVRSNLRKTSFTTSKTSARFTVTNNSNPNIKIAVRYKKTGSVKNPLNVPSDIMSLHTLINEVRAAGVRCGGEWQPAVPPLKLDPKLVDSAQNHADDMKTRGYFNHVSPDGVEFDSRIRKAGYKGDASAENIASGQSNAQAVVSSWIASPAHCLNLMDSYSNEVGYGYATKHQSGYTVPLTWWVADFGRR